MNIPRSANWNDQAGQRQQDRLVRQTLRERFPHQGRRPSSSKPLGHQVAFAQAAAPSQSADVQNQLHDLGKMLRHFGMLGELVQQQLQAIQMPHISTESPYNEERVELERALASLGQQGDDATVVQRRVATETWQRVLSMEPKSQLPALGLKDDGVLYLSWNYKQARSSVHIGPDGKIEWYFKDNQTGALVGSDAEPVDEVPPLFFSLMRAFHRP